MTVDLASAILAARRNEPVAYLMLVEGNESPQTRQLLLERVLAAAVRHVLAEAVTWAAEPKAPGLYAEECISDVL